MPWYYAVAERDHEIQNPTTADKIVLLGRYLRLGPDTRVLDLACGKAGPAALLASTFGCHVVGIERSHEFVESAREHVAETGVADRVEIVEADAHAFPLEADSWDAILCLGATFVWDDLAGTLAALTPGVRPGGHVVVGEPYWRQWPLPRGIEDQGFVSLHEASKRVDAAGLALVALIASDEDDWDRYESLHWLALESWLAENPKDPDAHEIRERHEQARENYLDYQRELLGWGMFVGRKPKAS
jgi:SAM-dependent methyltransferase